jgi:hypothetical protein
VRSASANRQIAPWATHIRHCGELPNVYAALSGLVTRGLLANLDRD